MQSCPAIPKGTFSNPISSCISCALYYANRAFYQYISFFVICIICKRLAICYQKKLKLYSTVSEHPKQTASVILSNLLRSLEIMLTVTWFSFLSWLSCFHYSKQLTRTSEVKIKSAPIWSTKSDRVNLVAPASPIECLLYWPKVRATQYKLRPERLTRLVNSNVLQLTVLKKRILTRSQ